MPTGEDDINIALYNSLTRAQERRSAVYGLDDIHIVLPQELHHLLICFHLPCQDASIPLHDIRPGFVSNSPERRHTPGGGGLDLRPGLAQCIFRHNPPQNLTSPRGAESATHLIIRITRATSYDASAGFFRRAYGQAVASSFLLHIAHSGNLMVRNEQQRQGWPGPSD